MLQAHVGPNAETDKPAWLEARRPGLTATEVRDLAKGFASDRNRIMAEKLDGTRPDLAGVPAVEYGNLREPMIAAWIEERFGIPASSDLYIRTDDPRRLATPDGVLVTPFGDVLVSETKTSKHDLTPGRLDESNTLIMTRNRAGRWTLDWEKHKHFAQSGYYDQMQWQMFVLGASRTLFAHEQHDGDWSGWPERAPRSLTPEPRWCWIERDEQRIAELIVIADDFLEDLEIQRELRAAAADADNIDFDVEADRLALQRKVRELGVEYDRLREAATAAATAKDAKWAELQDALAGMTDLVIDDDDLPVRISLTTGQPGTTKKFDEQLARTKAPKMFADFERFRLRYTIDTPKPASRTLVVKRKAS